MAKDIPIGARAVAEETVEFRHTLTAHHPELPPVYSTPDMIRLMETAAFHALQPYCEGDEITVGTSINIEHRAAVASDRGSEPKPSLSPSMDASIPCGLRRAMKRMRLAGARSGERWSAWVSSSRK